MTEGKGGKGPKFREKGKGIPLLIFKERKGIHGLWI